MKKITLIILSIFLMSIGNAQTTIVGGLQWQSFNNPGAPPTGNWQTSPIFLVGWGAPGQGNPNTFQLNSYNATNPYSNPVTLNNAIWTTLGNVGVATSFFKTVVNAGDLSNCESYFLIANADDQVTFWINGNLLLTSVNWQANVNIEITDLLTCGPNVITARVNDLGGGPRFLIAEIQEVDTPILYDIITTIDCDEDNVFTATVTSSLAGDINWTGSDGYTNTGNTVSFNPDIHSSGWYYFSTQSDEFLCCTLDSIFVEYPCCDESIELDRDGCYSGIFRLTDRFVNTTNVVWLIDGEIFSQGNDGEAGIGFLESGEHEICVKYFGINKYDPNVVCCGEDCIDFIIPETVVEDTTIYLCATPGNTHNFLFSFCEYEYFILNYSNPITGHSYQYDVRDHPSVNCSASWDLIPGNFSIEFYDENDCLVKTLNINVVETEPIPMYPFANVVELSYCNPESNGVWVDVSTYIPSFFLNWDYIVIDQQTGETIYTASENNYNTNVLLSEGQYEIRVFDIDNCRYSYVFFDVTAVYSVAYFCPVTIDIPCGTEVNLDDYLGQCENCNIPAGLTWKSAFTDQVISNPSTVNASGTYWVEYFDETTCSLCRIEVSVNKVMNVVYKEICLNEDYDPITNPSGSYAFDICACEDSPGDWSFYGFDIAGAFINIQPCVGSFLDLDDYDPNQEYSVIDGDSCCKVIYTMPMITQESYSGVWCVGQTSFDLGSFLQQPCNDFDQVVITNTYNNANVTSLLLTDPDGGLSIFGGDNSDGDIMCFEIETYQDGCLKCVINVCLTLMNCLKPSDEETSSRNANSEVIRVHPNPSSGIFNIEYLDEHSTIELDILDSQSKLILEDKIQENATRSSIDLTDMLPGIYYFHFNSAKWKKSIKVMKY